MTAVISEGSETPHRLVDLDGTVVCEWTAGDDAAVTRAAEKFAEKVRTNGVTAVTAPGVEEVVRKFNPAVEEYTILRRLQGG